MRRISLKMAEQRVRERELSWKLLERCHGLCMDCQKLPDWRGLSKHEVVFRSHGGNPLDESNTLLLCAKCHSKRHGITEV